MDALHSCLHSQPIYFSIYAPYSSVSVTIILSTTGTVLSCAILTTSSRLSVCTLQSILLHAFLSLTPHPLPLPPCRQVNHSSIFTMVGSRVAWTWRSEVTHISSSQEFLSPTLMHLCNGCDVNKESCTMFSVCHESHWVLRKQVIFFPFHELCKL